MQMRELSSDRSGRVLVIAGTRPEAIKLAPVIRELRGRERAADCVVASTGQHKELLHQAFQDFDVTPDIDIAVMEPDQGLAALTGKLLVGIDRVLEQVAPDRVVVQGDTTTALAGALSAFYRQIPVAHVEAGLRTYDRFAPFPEETNRQCISRLADLHFANTTNAIRNLRREGIDRTAIVLSGSTSIDAIQWMRTQIRSGQKKLGPLPDVPSGCPILLMTCHRRESFGAKMDNVWLAILELLRAFDDLVVVFPVHPNPHVREPVMQFLGGHPRAFVIDPVPYPEMVALLDRADIVLTDSGGLQEEVPGLGKPLLVLRDTTERAEAIAAGAAVLVGTDKDRIVTECRRLLNEPELFARFGSVVNPFGDGHAAERIVDALTFSGAAGTIPFDYDELAVGDRA